MTHLSKRIRELVSESPMSASELHGILSDYNVSITSLRGTIQSMTRVGILTKIGSRPYQYTLGEREPRGYREPEKRKKKLSKKNVAQLIREQLKIKNMAPAEVAPLVGVSTDRAFGCMRDMKRLGHVAKMDDGRYMFVRDPNPRMSAEERREKKNAAMRAKRLIAPKPQRPVKPYTAISPKKPKDQHTGPKQSVEEWIKDGGVIDRSPTIPKFERLTIEDISNHALGYAPSSKVRTVRSYLAG